MNLVVICLNYLCLGRPSRCPAHLFARTPLTGRQWRIVRHFERLLNAWIDHEEIGPETMGRSAPKIESLEEAIKDLENCALRISEKDEAEYRRVIAGEMEGGGRQHLAGRVVGETEHASYNTFKRLEPDRLQFVGLPLFDPIPYLDEESVYIYQHPLEARAPGSSWDDPILIVKLHCPLEEKMKLFELLDTSQRLALFAPSEVDERFASGMFAVVKLATRNRMIMDSRPGNLLEQPLKRFVQSLGSCETLSRLYLPEGF